MLKLEITAPAGFFEMDWWAETKHMLHEGAEMLGELLQFTVSSRTPVDTGALLADVSFDASYPPDSNNLVRVYSDTTEQVAEWDRVYMLYQEGGLLGLETYTNAPHEMYGKILTDDIPAIEEWGNQWLQWGMDRIAAAPQVSL